MIDQTRRTGRPVKPARPGQRASLGLKVTAEIKQQLDAAAQASGRTQSQEAEARLERSFQNERLLPELLEIGYGRPLAGLLLILGRVMNDAGAHSGAAAAEPFSGAANWFSSQVAYAEAAQAAQSVLDALRPTDEPEDISPIDRKAAAGLGLLFAAGALEAIANPNRGGEIGVWANSIRNLLGPAAERIHGDFEEIAVSSVSPNPTTPAAFVRMTRAQRGSRK